MLTAYQKDQILRCIPDTSFPRRVTILAIEREVDDYDPVHQDVLASRKAVSPEYGGQQDRTPYLYGDTHYNYQLKGQLAIARNLHELKDVERRSTVRDNQCHCNDDHDLFTFVHVRFVN